MAPRCVLMVSKGVPWFAMQYAMECPGPGGAFHGVFHGINVFHGVLKWMPSGTSWRGTSESARCPP